MPCRRLGTSRQKYYNIIINSAPKALKNFRLSRPWNSEKQRYLVTALRKPFGAFDSVSDKGGGGRKRRDDRIQTSVGRPNIRFD